MKAIRVHETGEPDVLKLEDVPDLVAGPGEIVIGVHAIGVNPVDTYVRSGRYPLKAPLPYTPGSDCAGDVIQVGQGVRSWRVGDRVYTSHLAKGAYAEQVVCKAEHAFALPDGVSYEAGAALGVPYATAYRALFLKAKAQAGQTVMVHGASGGVGVASVQLAKNFGLTVCGTAGTPEGLEFIAEQGAKYVLNHHDPDYMSDALGATCGAGFDIILEMLANENLGNDLGVLAPNGIVVVVGNRGTVEINPRDLMARDACVTGTTLFNSTPDEVVTIHAGLAAGLANGTLKPVIGKKFSLADAPAAHVAVLEGGSRGKILLVP